MYQFFFSDPTRDFSQVKRNKISLEWNRGVDVDFQMVRSLVERKKKGVDSKNDLGKGKKTWTSVTFKNLTSKKKSDRCVFRERERERGRIDLFRTTAKLLSKVFFNEENSIDEPIHRNLCRALIEANK